MRPVGPISYEESEDLVSYYLATYDDRGKLATFTKFLREAHGEYNLETDDDLVPGTRLYFDVTRFGQPGVSITFSETEHLDNFFRSAAASSERPVKLEMISRVMFFSDEYTYWPSGALRHRIARKSDGSRVETSFDESGRQEHAPQVVPH